MRGRGDGLRRRQREGCGGVRRRGGATATTKDVAGIDALSPDTAPSSATTNREQLDTAILDILYSISPICTSCASSPRQRVRRWNLSR